MGVRESAQSWRELLIDLKARGLAIAPELATGDGALGFWRALDGVSPTDPSPALHGAQDRQRVRQAAQIVHPEAKSDLREVWAAPDRATAEAAIATFADKHGAKYDKAVTCLVKDRDALLTFFDFPAEHWRPRGMCSMATIWASVAWIICGAERRQVHRIYSRTGISMFSTSSTTLGATTAEWAALCDQLEDEPPLEN